MNNSASNRTLILTYPAIFGYEKGREISIVFPDLDAATSGVDNADALTAARECLEIALRGLREDGVQFPAPTRFEDMQAFIAENEHIYDINAVVDYDINAVVDWSNKG